MTPPGILHKATVPSTQWVDERIDQGNPIWLYAAALFVALLSFSTPSHAQSAEQWTAWGDASAERGEHYGASRFYAGALKLEPTRMSLQWKHAEACRLSNQYDKAAEQYANVHRKDMGRTHPEALRWLAEMLMCQGRYDDAEVEWKKVAEREKDPDSFAAKRARNGLAGCALAREALASPTGVEVLHLPSPVNTYDSEFGARIGPDSALHFTSLRGELNKDEEVKDTAAYRAMIYRAIGKELAWSEATPLDSVINGPGDNANNAWSLDGNWFLFTRCLPGPPCQLYAARSTRNRLSNPKPVQGLGNDLHSTQPMVASVDGVETLFFISDRPGGQGGTDIWRAEFGNGRARNPQPLGPTVNTPGNEQGPWFDAVTGKLWFSSDFLPGMGGYDIFTSAYANDAFAAPEHQGSPINSPANDLYPVYDDARNEGWLTSNRLGSLAAKGATCCNDLYRFKWPREEPIVVVEEDEPIVVETVPPVPVSSDERITAIKQRFPLKLYFHNDDPDPRSWNTRTAQDYAMAYHRYKGLVPEYEREGEAEALRAFFRDHVDHGWAELAELVAVLHEVLGEGKSVTLEVRGHASPLARSNYNINLSMRRIESLRNHLRRVDDGALRAYMDGKAPNGARLSVRELPYGEDRAKTGISDELSDLKRSVYSVEASLERRIEIESIELHGTFREEPVGSTPPVDAGPRQPADGLRQQVGELKQGEERSFTFTVRNTGTTPMRLLESRADCGCTAALLPMGTLAPGGEVPVAVTFNGRAPLGRFHRTVTLLTDGTPERVELVLEGNVVP